MITGFLNLIYITFPYLCYCVYIIYSKSKLKEENLLFFDLSLVTSFYLCVRFGYLDYKTAFLINIPLIISFYFNRKFVSMILILMASIYLSRIYNINIFLYIFSYLLIIILNNVIKEKQCLIFSVVKLLLIMTSIFLNKTLINTSNIFFIIIYFAFINIFGYIFVYLYKKISQTIKIYNSLKIIEKEKKLYESLFKITHEIKNPLAVCKGYLDMFDINNKEKSNKYINIINQEIDRTLLLLNDFSSVSKINIKKEKMDINMLLFDVCDEFTLVYTNNIKFVYDINDEEVFIDGDYNRLKQVFINILKNSKEAIKTSGSVTLTTKKTKTNYIITIKDTGIGMDKETMKKIGTAFYTTKKNGTGLGVCFSKEIIERHDGIITYKSKDKIGTTVRIMLPLKK